MTRTFRKITTAAVLAGSTAWAGASAAQDYPAGNINVVVPFPPGGGTDVMARLVLDTVARQTGWTFVVINQPGAGGSIGMDQLARATPDGLTIGMGQTSNLAVNPALNPEVEYGPLADFAPVALIATQPMGIITFTDSPHADMAAVLAEARDKPGSVLFGTPGEGTVAHMSIERLMHEGDLELEHVPYTGVAQAISDVMAGVVDIYIGSLPSVLTHVTAGTVRPLAVTSAQPDPLVPDVPTLASLGFEGYATADWKAVVGPAGMPPEAVAALNAAFVAALDDADLRAALETQGSQVLGGSPEDLAAFLAQEVATWAGVVEAAATDAE